MSFAACLERGRLGESLIARWIAARGNVVLPAYEIEIDSGKGPRVVTASDELVSPDLIVIRPGQSAFWVEAKHKSRFTWYRKGQRWETGIDDRHYLDYLRVRECSRLPVWLLFLHRRSDPWHGDQPHLPASVTECPVGLFGIEIAEVEPRYAPQHASGMRYWPHSALRLIADLGAVCHEPSHTPRSAPPNSGQSSGSVARPSPTNQQTTTS